MPKRLFIFIFLFSTMLTYSQVKLDTINRFDENGKKFGYWEKRDNGDILIYKGRFDHGRPVGTFYYYFPDTRLKAEVNHNYVGLSDSAYTITYHHNGKVMAKGVYRDKQKDGLWRYYNDKESLLSQENYDKGWRVGRAEIYQPNGTLAEIQYWKENYEDSVWVSFNENGNLVMERFYVRGRLNGRVTTYYDSGAKKMEGDYKNGDRVGEWIYYKEDGEIKEKVDY